MMTVVTLATQTATGTSASVHIPPLNKFYTPVNTGVVQVTGQGAVQLEGSCDNVNFQSIATSVTSNAPKAVVLMPYMRANCTAYTTGDVVTRICF